MWLSLVRVLLSRLLALRLDRNRVLLLLVQLRVDLLRGRLLRHLLLLLLRLLLLVGGRSLTAPGRRGWGLGRCALLLGAGRRSRCLRDRHRCLHRRMLLRVVLGVRRLLLLLLVRGSRHGSRMLRVLAMLAVLPVLDVTRVLRVLGVRRVVVRLLVLSMVLLLLLLLLSGRVGLLGVASEVGATRHVSLLRVLVLRTIARRHG